ncbi:MAG: prepilin-type N-terminal cleavage/methylation domain-containing protein [Planctomycetota bacterium]|nr:prepilin-type N-terminal cleavage/methylation domain-containing protein [Planctomycetota bacterium]
MTAIHASSATRSRSGARRRSIAAPRGFTLTELLIVIALIVLLITLLLAALDAVQDKARETRTMATMQAFTNASNAFQQEQGFYPGVVPEHILAWDASNNEDGLPGISGTENAMLHLTGGYIREDDVTDTEWDAYAGQVYVFDTPSGGFYRIKVDFADIGEGPTINGKAYPPYFTPGEKEFAAAKGQVGPTGFGQQQRALPDVIDAWGQPIAFLRRMRTVGPLTAENLSLRPQFDAAPLRSYTRSGGLGRLNRDQAEMSILNTTSDAVQTLARIVEHPSLPGQARGAFMLLSAGPDAIFLSREDGPGSPETPVDDIYDPDVYPKNVIEEYDDVLMFGGD